MDENLRSDIRAAHAALAEARAADAGGIAWRRVERLCDPGTFVEYGPLAGRSSSPGDTHHADGLIAGAGLVLGMPVMVAASDRAVLDGTQSSRNQRKIARLLQIAHRERWPVVLLLDGDGARPGESSPEPPIMVAPRGRYGLFDGLAELNGWAPTIACIAGRALDAEAGAALLCDFVVATADAEIGVHDGDRIVTHGAEELAKRGDVDRVEEDEARAIAALRTYLAFHAPDRTTGEPAGTYPVIADIVPENRRRPYDMRKIIDAFADAASTFELAPSFGRSMLTVLARLNGRTIGIFANQPRSPLAGAIDPDAADKASRFVELCDVYGFPLVSFVDNPGYMVGPQVEAAGIARHHARPLLALHHRSVPLCSIQIRKAYGLGPFAMSGWGTSRNAPLLRLAWPSVESGGMSLEGAAYIVMRKEIDAAKTPEEALAIRNAYADRMRDTTSGLRAGRIFQFDDVIEPATSRERIDAMLARSPRRRSATRAHAIDLR
jgi:acetyl-CoA carboxylase carboxyltransferase component